MEATNSTGLHVGGIYSIPVVCHPALRISSHGLWVRENPTTFAFPLFLLQASLTIVTMRVASCVFRPLGPNKIITNIIGGIILGPSVLGQSRIFARTVFPPQSLMILDTAGMLGLTLFLFLTGVKIDLSILRNCGGKALRLGTIITLFPAIALSLLIYALWDYIQAGPMKMEMVTVAILMSISSFPVISITLSELEMLNTEVGRLAILSSMGCDMLTFILTAVVITLSVAATSLNRGLWATSSLAALVCSIYCIFKPLASWIVSKTPENQPVNPTHIFIILMGVMITALAGEMNGQHATLGPLVLGMVIPVGPPLGSALADKLELVVMELLFPLFFASCGLRVNVYSVKDWRMVWLVITIVIVGCLVKLLGSILRSRCSKQLPLQEAVIFGLIMCSKGIVEFVTIYFWKNSKVVGEQLFVIFIFSIVVVSSICTRLVAILCKQNTSYLADNWRTIDHTAGSELRLLACIHSEDDMPHIISLLQISNPSRWTPLAVYAVHLVELVGRASPLLVTHVPHKPSTTSSSITARIVKALQYYKHLYHGHVSVQSFTAIAPYGSMHNDICSLALSKHASLVVVPFQKHPTIHGKMVANVRGHAIQTINQNVLEEAPCSVGILVNRRPHWGKVASPHHSYRLAVLFLGGRDDREVLAYAARMATNRNVSMNVVRCIPLEGQPDDRKEKQLDDEMVASFMVRVSGNKQAIYREEKVADGDGILSIIRSMGDTYDLFMVGRSRGTETTLLSGMMEWSQEDCELGILGDYLASPDYKGAAAVLVVQQQSRVRSRSGS